MVGSIDDLVRRGRASGIGVTLITQRTAAINKDVLTQIEVLIALRTISPQDRKAVESWIEAHDVHGQKQEFMSSLASLQIGEAWFWSPGWLDEFRRIQIRQRETFDSSATPKIGERIATPQAVSAIDLNKIEQRLVQVLAQKAALQQLEQRIRRGITELDQELAQPLVVERIEVPIFQDGQVERLEVAIGSILEMGDRLTLLGEEMKALLQAAAKPVVEPAPIPEKRTQRELQSLASAQSSSSLLLKAGKRNMLAVLATCPPMKLSRIQLGSLSGFAHSGGTFGNYLSTLKRHVLVLEGNKRLEITPAGLSLLQVDPIPLTSSRWRSMWQQVLKAGERKMLEVLIDAYPGELSRYDIGHQAGYESTGGTFGNYLSTLRRNELVVEVRGSMFRANSRLIEAEVVQGGNRHD